MERIICVLVFALLSLSAQDEFIFWAELSNKDLILYHQSQSISSAMTQSEAVDEDFACELGYSEDDLSFLQKTALGVIDDEMPKALKLRFLNNHKERLFECFSKAEVRVSHTTKTQLLQAQSTTYLKFIPLRFRVYFANDKALIYQLIKQR
ncbi:hypothetical protein DMB95_01290 [Campylobacter sp. MIT 12-8780]|uniref:hypothetical protein n=1 Tax=unclassified Campylobacter TaxID=2593542 RepID=UPI00115F07D8|nr:hypothetical protein [Campylobacter sp. MIT 12-8780]NDJ26595.1 hypothetical protein [Campylobacter sp. MIT 19-121]TQR43161.1 hypothetical protein DMB95_01290 [Campylobacter sp. MIT 12-8780]